MAILTPVSYTHLSVEYCCIFGKNCEMYAEHRPSYRNFRPVWKLSLIHICMCVALSAALVYDKKTVVLSILGTYFNGIVLDHFIFDNSIRCV